MAKWLQHLGNQILVLHAQCTVAAKSTSRHGLLVYFGGDIQASEPAMRARGCGNFSQWSTEGTIGLFQKQFPEISTFVAVLASRFHKDFACYDNFIPSTSEDGSPLILSSSKDDLRALKHLEKLLHYSGNNFQVEDVQITLVGFSKGCIVLNQLLYEISANGGDSNWLIESIGDIYLLDGGHNNRAVPIWIQDERVLERLKHKPGRALKLHLRVTPRQIKDKNRPWIGDQEEIFCRLLEKLQIPFDRRICFGDKCANLVNHFRVLECIAS